MPPSTKIKNSGNRRTGTAPNRCRRPVNSPARNLSDVIGKISPVLLANSLSVYLPTPFRAMPGTHSL